MFNFQSLSVWWIGLFFLVQAVWPEKISADDKTVITAGPSWVRFTNIDGQGLYHEIISRVFTGYQVKHIYVSTIQAKSMVAVGRADIKLCETIEDPPLIIASIPMYENDYFVLYMKNNIPQWEGERSLAGKKLVWRQGYYTKADFPVPVDFLEVRSGESALKMVEHGRADLYVDDFSLIMQSFSVVGENFNAARFGLQRIGTRKYYPVFADTVRGKDLRNHYEEEMQRLYREGILQKIYEKWNFPIPQFSFITAGKQQVSETGAGE